MTNPNASLEGSILTPKGWVRGRVVLDGPSSRRSKGALYRRAPGQTRRTSSPASLTFMCTAVAGPTG